MYFQLAFAVDRVKTLAPEHPEWQRQQPFKALLAGDTKAVAAQGEKALLQVIAVAHSGMTTEAFAKTVAAWIATARHPRFGKPYTELTYRPMHELLDYLRANDFKTFIVSGGGVEFMRTFAERVYGIPPQVVGSSGVTRFRIGPDGKPELTKQAKVEFIDDGPGKPSGINRFIGRRPIFAFGNSATPHRSPNPPLPKSTRECYTLLSSRNIYATTSTVVGRRGNSLLGATGLIPLYWSIAGR
jgi:hypothetical protein